MATGLVAVPPHRRHIAKTLFTGYDATPTLLQAVLQGHHGQLWVDSQRNPALAKIDAADFVFLAGDADSALATVAVRELDNVEVVVDPAMPPGWLTKLRECHRGFTFGIDRVSFSSAPTDLGLLVRHIDSLPAPYTMQQIDAPLAARIYHTFDEVILDCFDSPDDFAARGVGFAALRGDQPVAFASSFATADSAIEIEIDTHPHFRRQGIATALAARLTHFCLDNGIYPHWDAANHMSVGLARKLGYTGEAPYKAIYVTRRPLSQLPDWLIDLRED